MNHHKTRFPVKASLLILVFMSITGAGWPFSNETGFSIEATGNTQDFRITAIQPSSVPADGTTAANSTIIVSPVNGFSGPVTLSDTPLPSGLSCLAFNLATVPGSGGKSSLSCTSNAAGSYAVNITGTNGTLTNYAIATFTFTSTTSPDFSVSTTSNVSFDAGSPTTLSVTIAPSNGFHFQVDLTAVVTPSRGLSITLNPQSILPSSASTATFISTTPGTYTVTITGTYDSTIRTATVQVTVKSTTIPDVTVTPSVSSFSLTSGTSGTLTITVAAQNGFTGSITLAVSAPSGVSCRLSPTLIQSSGTSTLTCNSSTAGNYIVTITATGGASPHTKLISVHVAAVSPAAPTPLTILGLDPTVFYEIIAAVIVVAAVGTVAVVRSRGSEFEA